MDSVRRHLERVRKMPQIPERGDSEGEELKMLPESSKVEVFDDFDNMDSKELRIVMDLSRKHHQKKETLARFKELYPTTALALSRRYQGLEMLPEPNWAIGDDADAMGSTELRRVMNLERR